MSLEKLLKKKSGIRLDIGIGPEKQNGHVLMRNKKDKGVDIVHDIQKFPWPLPDESCLQVVGFYIFSRVRPENVIKFMDEAWRVLKPAGQLALSVPYSVSFNFIADPLNCNPCNEATFRFFDSKDPRYQIHQPKPWKVVTGYPVWHAGGNMEVLMEKVCE